MEIALIKAPLIYYDGSDYEESHVEVSWRDSEFLEWEEVTQKEFDAILDFARQCRNNPKKYKATRNSPFSEKGYIIVIRKSQFVDATLANAKELAMELLEEKTEANNRKAARDKIATENKKAKALEKKRKQLEKLKEELGEN